MFPKNSPDKIKMCPGSYEERSVDIVSSLTFAIAALASLDTLQLAGKQSLMIFVTIEVGRFRSSGLSAIVNC